MPTGAMLSVSASAADVKTFLNEDLALAASNAPSLCVVSGSYDAIDKIAEKLTGKGIECRSLHTSHAFHSQMMEPMLEPFITELKKVKLNPPQIPFISNLTGTWISAQEATSPDYWAQHLRQTVQFSDGLSVLLQETERILLEVGPGRTLCTFVKQHTQQAAAQVVLPSLRHPQEEKSDVAFLLNILGRLWLAGIEINWSGFYTHEQRYRIPLPTYPFERQRYWIETQAKTGDVNNSQESKADKLDIADWFYVPSWQKTISHLSLNQNKLEQKQSWLIFVDNCEVAYQVTKRLENENQKVIIVKAGERFIKCSDREYIINPKNSDDYNALIKELRLLNQIPKSIAHFWNITSNNYIKSELEKWEELQVDSFWSLLFLAQALGEHNITNSIRIDIISNHLQKLTDNDELCPAKATLLGPCKVIPQEYPNISCRSIDINLPLPASYKWQQLIENLFVELTTQSSESVIVYRANQRWVRYFEKLSKKNTTLKTPKLRQEGVYLITGGLGGIGLAFAEHLAKTVKAKLVLVGRSEFPVKKQWQQWLSEHNKENIISDKIQRIQALEALGTKVLVLQADVANHEQMQEVMNKVADNFGTIHGVIHAAGLPGEGLIQFKTPEIAENVLLPKLKGTLVLDNLLQDINLDFFVLFSSLTSICGGLGQVDYCAANAFLDAFSHNSIYNRNRLTISINWDAWEWDKWQNSLLSSVPQIQAWFQERRTKYGIKFGEGIDAFDRILSWQLSQVIVATRSLDDLIVEYDSFALSQLIKQLEKSPVKSSKNNSQSIDVAPHNAIEHTV
ncbi:MAG: SDR family NAD(P)-dependent oxidoreductase, partial [Nostoc sp. C3-bin3]|nr:SDR family NAD(P)-dependent oxidoreductase [Nostoc sp. C3-bin3]